MTRQEHLQCCKERALEYADQGNAQDAVASMLSDLEKHPETAHFAKSLGPMAMMMLISGQLTSPQEIRKFIEGFN